MSFEFPALFAESTLLAAVAIARRLVSADAGVACCPRAPRPPSRLRYPTVPNPIAPRAAATRRRPAPGNATSPPIQAKSAAAKEPHHQGDRKGEAGREIGQRHFQPRSVPAAEGRRQIDGIAAACGGQAGFGAAGGDRRVRIVVDRRVTARRRPNSPIPTGWRRNCTGNIRAPTSPSSIAARAAKTRPK